MQPRTPVCRFTSSRVCRGRGLHGPLIQTGSAPSSVQCRSRTSMMMTTRRRRTASTVATTSRQQMLDLWIFAKSAWQQNETHDKRLCPADTSAFVVPVSQRLRKKVAGLAAARCAARQFIVILCLFYFFARTVRPTLYFPQLCFSDICLPMWGLFATSQCGSLCRPFYFGLSVNKIGVAYV